MGAGCAHHLAERAGVVQQRAGAQMVVAEGLMLVVLHEQRRLVRLKQRLFVYVGVGVVYEGARLYVAARVYVQVIAASGYAAVYVFAVVPEVQREQLLGAAPFTYLVEHVLALLGAGHQLWHGVYAHGHIGEEPRELAAPVNHGIHILVRTYHVGVERGVAYAGAKEQVIALEYLHGLHYGLERTLAAAGIGGFFKALHADGRHEVAHAQHLLSELLVYKGGVGEGQEHAVRMALAQRDDVLFAHQRLAAREYVHERTHGSTLLYYRLHGLQAKVELVAVFSRPAAGAVQVAGAGGVHQYRPRHVAVVLAAHLVLALAADYGGVDYEVLEQRMAHFRVEVCPYRAYQAIPVVVGIIDHLAERGYLTGNHVQVAVQLLHPVHHLGYILIGIIIQILYHLLETECLYSFRYRHICHCDFLHPLSFDYMIYSAAG